MHQIEPFWKWRDHYIAQEDKRSPFFGVENSEFEYSRLVYNYYIHPQWDDFGSNTLYIKVLYADYEEHSAIMEFIGEWNDAIGNDIMYLKREVVDLMIQNGIYKFILIGENVLNFHASENDYYEEWCIDIEEEGGWIIALNFRDHVIDEMFKIDMHRYVYLNERFVDVPWRRYKPGDLVELLDGMLMKKLT